MAGRSALVTGGARRIGRAIALTLAAHGWDVAVHYGTSRDDAEALAGEIRRRDRRAAAIAADLTREAEVATLVPRAAEAVGPLSLLVNNASAFDRDDVLNVTRAGWDRHLETNLRAPFVLMQEFARQLPAGAEGSVINILDERVWNLTPYFTSYTVSKAALWTLTQTMALALAPRIRVNGIGPGPTLPSPRQSDEQFRQQVELLPLRRGTTPDEIARTVMFILESPSMTGQMIALDGGQHLNWAPTSRVPPASE
ncbi:MAG: SDR family oxidoreductase [Alphaproteobacteria bacterium]|nr:SDR family oxidoreductase [Alphaproteobacteria bacterium]MDE1931407.1 SDR family oxidoreductase [Alphaproteobacteria bacterium]